MVDERSNDVAFRCECGKHLRLSASVAGRRAKCPQCQAVFTVPPPQDDAHDGDAFDDGLSLLDELARQEEAAEPALPIAMQPATSAINEARALHARGAAKAGPSQRLAGTTLLGSVLSVVGAAFGAVVWVVIAIMFDREIGFVAWVVGGLAGWGMLLGRGRLSGLGGMLAAGSACAGIVAAKVAIFAYVPSVLVTGQTGMSSAQQVLATAAVAQEILDERGVTDEDEREAQLDDALAEASDRVKHMTGDQVEEKWRRYQQQHEGVTVEAAPVDDARRDRLAWHYADLEAMDQGLSPWDEQREVLYEEQLAAYRDLPDAELAAEIAQLEAWLATGRWSDRQYIRARLIYDRLETLLEFFIKVPDSKWREFYAEVGKEVDAMPFAEQVEAVRALEGFGDDFDDDFDEEVADTDDTEFAEDAKDQAESVVGGFLAVMFGFYDMIFVVLAAVTAYCVAADGSCG